MRVVIFLGIGLLAASSAFAHKSKDEGGAGTDPNKVICKTEDVLGSRLASQKQCMTEAQWIQLRREQRNTVEKMQNANGGAESHF